MKIYNFSDAIRSARKAKELPLRKVAALLDIDQSTLSKIERGSRPAPRELIKSLSEILGLEYEELLANYLSDKVAYSIIQEDDYEIILSFAEKKVKTYQSANSKQLNLSF